MISLADRVLDLYALDTPQEALVLWQIMPSDVRMVLRRLYWCEGAAALLNKIGFYLCNERWSITPYPPELRQDLDLHVRAQLTVFVKNNHV
ncbi:MAG: hypothetical protein P8Q92_04945 [Pseudoprimorskyibacter sp.]|nr:hypothetical protein [Pseudoprimorskyibacter sp.]